MVDIKVTYSVFELTKLQPILKELSEVGLSSKFSYEISSNRILSGQRNDDDASITTLFDPCSYHVNIHFIIADVLPLEWYKRLFFTEVISRYNFGMYHDDNTVADLFYKYRIAGIEW